VEDHRPGKPFHRVESATGVTATATGIQSRGSEARTLKISAGLSSAGCGRLLLATGVYIGCVPLLEFFFFKKKKKKKTKKKRERERKNSSSQVNVAGNSLLESR
jgi:hypothetical protein